MQPQQAPGIFLAPIQALDAHTIDQIAAGEVVERPASVVKELVENALDAGASRVDVRVEEGGLKSICVADDGHGMPPEDARLAILRHATSKIRRLQDLQQITTFGFRGEALSSIASIAHFTLTSRAAHQEVGYSLTVAGGQVVAEGAVGCPPGTQILVRDLFYNVPARRKFMRAPATEQALVQEVLVRTFLGVRRGALRYTAGTRQLLQLPGTLSGTDRALRLLGRRVSALLPFARAQAEAPRSAGGARGPAVSGWLSPPTLSRAEGAGIWLFVDGRFVRDRMLQRAVLAGYQLAFPDSFPTALIYLDLPAGAVDVNVHPQKLEVRFDDAQPIYCAVRDAVAVAAARLQGQGRAAPKRPRPASEVPPPAPVAAVRQMLKTRSLASEGPTGPAAAAALPAAASAAAVGSGVPALSAAAPAAAAGAVQPARAVDGRLTPLGFAPAGYMACQQGDTLVLVPMARAIAHCLVAAERAPAAARSQRLLLPPTFVAQATEVACLDDFLLAAAEQPAGNLWGLHLVPVAAGHYLVQALPLALRPLAPLDVMRALVTALRTAPLTAAQAPQSAAAAATAALPAFARALAPLFVAAGQAEELVLGITGQQATEPPESPELPGPTDSLGHGAAIPPADVLPAWVVRLTAAEVARGRP